MFQPGDAVPSLRRRGAISPRPQTAGGVENTLAGYPDGYSPGLPLDGAPGGRWRPGRDDGGPVAYSPPGGWGGDPYIRYGIREDAEWLKLLKREIAKLLLELLKLGREARTSTSSTPITPRGGTGRVTGGRPTRAAVAADYEVKAGDLRRIMVILPSFLRICGKEAGVPTPGTTDAKQVAKELAPYFRMVKSCEWSVKRMVQEITGDAIDKIRFAATLAKLDEGADEAAIEAEAQERLDAVLGASNAVTSRL